MVRQRESFATDGNSVPWVFFFGGLLVLASIVGAPIFYYGLCQFNVPTGYMAVLTRKTGRDIANGDELAPDATYKGLQKEVLAEGRHFRNPWTWDWEVVPQVEIPPGKTGVRIRLHGDDPPGGETIAWRENEKGIVPGVLRPGRYPINAVVSGQTRQRDNYAEIIELHDMVTVPAGFRGVVTNLAGPMPKDPNTIVLLPSDQGKRGVESQTLDAETYPELSNPYIHRVQLVDCRSQRFNLSQDGDMGFPSKDGFWVVLDGIIEFRVMPEKAAEVYVIYNQLENDSNGTRIDEEVIKKVVLPNARSFCRLRGSDHSGREFISGDTRTKFQEDFQKELEKNCESQGIEIIQALITKISPPQQIAQPVRDRQIAVEKKKQFGRQLLQQESEKQLAIETEMNQRLQALVGAQQQVIKITTEASQAQEIAVIEANKRLKVAELDLQAATDLAAATLARGTADAKVVEFQNAAEAAGWQKAVQAFGGSGDEYARWTLLKKLAPAYRSIMVNTHDSPIMDIFRQYEQQSAPPKPVKTAGGN
ncbi:MAG TPA: SPFH domain-containing protein [Pirellulaceae bacterium]|nr:SPFH domain-containing protein [Pirellulaceae bacterium]